MFDGTGNLGLFPLDTWWGCACTRESPRASEEGAHSSRGALLKPGRRGPASRRGPRVVWAAAARPSQLAGNSDRAGMCVPVPGLGFDKTRSVELERVQSHRCRCHCQFNQRR